MSSEAPIQAVPPKRLSHWLLAPLEWLLALIILFEEWGWEPIQRVMRRLSRWAPIARVERMLAALPPWAALLAFILPSLTMLPVNLFGVWLVGDGRHLSGTIVVVGAKLVSTSLIGRLFTLTRPALLQLGWFATIYQRWQIWEAALLAPVRASWLWRAGRDLKRRWREWRARRFG